MTNDYDPELSHSEAVMQQISERIAAASLLALSESDDGYNPLLAIAENAFMTGIAMGVLAPAWARVLHEDAARANDDQGLGSGRMADIVADIQGDFPLGEAQ